MTPQENFRLGFLLRCAEEGCTAEEIAERADFAITRIKQADSTTGETVWGLAKAIAALPLHTGVWSIGAGGLAGAAGGYGLAKMQNSDIDPAEAKQQELVAAMRLQAEMARRRAAQRQYRRTAPLAPTF